MRKVFFPVGRRNACLCVFITDCYQVFVVAKIRFFRLSGKKTGTFWGSVAVVAVVAVILKPITATAASGKTPACVKEKDEKLL